MKLWPIILIFIFGCASHGPESPKPVAPPIPAFLYPTNAPKSFTAARPLLLFKAQQTISQTPSVILLTASSATVAWIAPDESFAGFNVYYGEQSRSYVTSFSAGTNLSAVVTNLEIGKTYYFAVTAYDAFGDESDFSNEAIYVAPPMIQATFDFPAAVASASVQASSDFTIWTDYKSKPVSLTDTSLTVWLSVTSSPVFFRAVGVAP